MKLTKTSKTLLVGTTILLAYAVWNHTATTPCKTSEQLACQDTQRNWLNWASGNSRSAQFHFVDFLELVSRMLPAKS